MVRRMSLRPVHRIKHVVDIQNATPVGSLVSQDLIDSKDAPVLANTDEVETGSTINGIYLNVEAYATSAAALSNFYLIIYKNPGGNISNPVPNAVGSNDNKRYVIHQEMKMLEQSTNGNPRTIFNGVIVIPKGYRRFAINDRLILVVLTPGVTSNFCVQCHYKEFR